jgi:hypothetical protein
MTDANRTPGQGSTPGIESQNTATGLGKPAQVPRDPDGPNPEPFDPEAEDLRPRPGEGAGDPRAGAGSLDDTEPAEVREDAGEGNTATGH